MKRYYQPKGGKKGRFALRENTYRRIWYMIADYPYFKSLESGLQFANSVAESKKQFANGEKEIRQEDAKSVAERAAIYDTGQISRYIEAIEDALEKIPEVYADHVLSHIIDRKRYKDMENVSERVVKIWVQRFIWYVAHNLGEA